MRVRVRVKWPAGTEIVAMQPIRIDDKKVGTPAIYHFESLYLSIAAKAEQDANIFLKNIRKEIVVRVGLGEILVL